MSKIVLLHPYSRPLRKEGENPKNFPAWQEVVNILNKEGIIVKQVGLPGEKKLEGINEYIFGKTLKELRGLIHSADLCCSIDSFFQHLCFVENKKCVVVFSQSDPNIFGHDMHYNLLKDRKYLRPRQCELWEQTPYIKEAFVSPEEVASTIILLLKKQ